MKNLFKILAVLFLLNSCSSDSSSNETENLLIGKWTYEMEKDYDASGALTTTYDWSQEPCYQLTTFDYQSNGQMVKVSYDFDNTCIQNPTRTYNYTVNGNTIVIDVDGIYQEQIIVENTTSVLKLKKTYSDNTYTVTEYSKLE